MYDFTVKAFELSEQFRTPVILLADEVIGHMREKTIIEYGSKNIKAGKRKYVVSPQADFFQGENSMVEGQLHDERGRRIGHMPDRSGEFIRSINKKISDNIDVIADVETMYMEDADVAILAWGSVVRPSMNAIKLARGVRDSRIRARARIVKDIFRRGISTTINADYSRLKVGLIKVNTVWPFPEKQIQEIAKNIDIVIVPEMNVGKYVREVQRALPDKKVVEMSKCGGEIHTPKEILDEILKEVGVNE